MFPVDGPGNKMRDWSDQAELFNCAAPGLRRAAATIAAETSATDEELMAIFGWTTKNQTTTYTTYRIVFRRWCPMPGSNQHFFRNSILSRARLPIPPMGQRIPTSRVSNMRPLTAQDGGRAYEADLIRLPAMFRGKAFCNQCAVAGAGSVKPDFFNVMARIEASRQKAPATKKAGR